MKLTNAQICVAAQWWTERLQVESTRDEFCAELTRELLAHEDISLEYQLVLHVDHDPLDVLLRALRAAGVECRGVMFSARGIFPFKTKMIISDEGIRAREGEGAEWVELTL